MPVARRSVVSTESVRRVRTSGLTTMRSTTTSTVCLRFLSSSILSLSSRISPSTRTRAKPSLAISSNSLAYSPLRPRIIGARSWMRVPSGKARIWSTICSGVCAETGLPHS